MGETGSSSNQSAEDSPESRHQEVVDTFVNFWGSMASRWGINRTMAQIHALLYCTEEPLNTDDIMERLQISRGNANMNLRSLVDWELVMKKQMSGSRKDFYVAEKDVWQITACIIKERQRREVKPIQDQLQECRDMLGASERSECDELSTQNQTLCHRFENLIELVDVFEGFSAALLPHVQEHNDEAIRQFIEMADAFDEMPSDAFEPSE